MRRWVALGFVATVVCASPFAHADFVRTLTGAAAFSDWRIDAPGLRFRITPADLPAPGASPPFANPPPDRKPGAGRPAKGAVRLHGGAVRGGA